MFFFILNCYSLFNLNLKNLKSSLTVLGKGSASAGIINCDEGYAVQGSEKMVCNIFGEWETDLPDCRCK